MLRLVTTAKQKLKVVVYTWACFNCKRPFRIPKKTWLKLQAGELNGVQCRRCLKPPSGGVAIAA